jgi:hypothetical protein
MARDSRFHIRVVACGFCLFGLACATFAGIFAFDTYKVAKDPNAGLGGALAEVILPFIAFALACCAVMYLGWGYALVRHTRFALFGAILLSLLLILMAFGFLRLDGSPGMFPVSAVEVGFGIYAVWVLSQARSSSSLGIPVYSRTICDFRSFGHFQSSWGGVFYCFSGLSFGLGLDGRRVERIA